MGSDPVAKEGGDVFGFDSEDGLPGKLLIEGFEDGWRAEHQIRGVLDLHETPMVGLSEHRRAVSRPQSWYRPRWLARYSKLPARRNSGQQPVRASIWHPPVLTEAGCSIFRGYSAWSPPLPLPISTADLNDGDKL